MATKTQKTTKIVNDGIIATEIIVKDQDIKYTGGEPLFALQPIPERRAGALVMAFNWYSKYLGRKDAKEQFAKYADYNGKTSLGKQLRRVDEKEIMPTLGWLARLSLRGLELTPEEKLRVDNEINRLVKTIAKPELIEKEEAAPVSNRPNVQEIMRERAREAAGDLEGEFDNFVFDAGAKSNAIGVNPVGVLAGRNVLPQHISILSEVWKKKLNEYQDVLAGEDPQLVEAYSHLSKHQVKAIIKFCEAVLSGLDSYINVKKASKAPRKRKAISPEKQAAKVKYLKTFEELKLVSIHPAKIVGAVEVWAYDTEKRKLHYYVADSHVGSLSVKGTTIMGFDATKSGIKTVRKPAEILKKLMAAGKPTARKVFSDINSVQAQSKGRTNDNLVILKAY